MEAAPGENIIFEGHPSWRSILGFYIWGLLIAVVIGAILFFAVGAGAGIAALVVVFALVVLVGLIKRIATVYAISNQRIHIKRGIIARKIQEARLTRVQNVNIQQGVLERVLRFGTVDFDTAGAGDSDFQFVGVHNPERVVRAVDEAHREAESAIAGPGPQGQSGLGSR